MGGCATKPKVLKGDQEGEVPEPVPEPVKEEASAIVSEAKEVVVVDDKAGDKRKVEGVGDGGDEVAKVKEIVEEGKADDQENKPRSLSNLFKTEEGQDLKPVDTDSTPSEPVKEESKEIEKPKEESETKPPEAEKSEIHVEQTPTPEFVDAPEKPVTEKTPEVTPVTETETKSEVSSEKKTVDTESSENKTEDAKSSEKKTEDTTPSEIKTEDEKLTDEKKIEEAK